jgi:hypothetical protein
MSVRISTTNDIRRYQCSGGLDGLPNGMELRASMVLTMLWAQAYLSMQQAKYR